MTEQMGGEHGAAPLGAGVTPAAVSVATKQNLPPAAAYGAVGLVAIIVIHVGYLQVHVLVGHRRTSQNPSARVCFPSTGWTSGQPCRFGTGLLQTRGGRWLLSSSHRTDRILQETQMQVNKPAEKAATSHQVGPHLLYFVYSSKLHSPFVLRGGKQHNWVEPENDTRAWRWWLNRGDGRELKLLSLLPCAPVAHTSAVGLLGGRLGLAEAHSGPLGAGEILWQGHVKDLVFQRVAVCRPTRKQTPAAFTSHL